MDINMYNLYRAVEFNPVLHKGRHNPIKAVSSRRYGNFEARAFQQLPQVRGTYWNLFNSGIRLENLAFPYVIFIVNFMDESIDKHNLRVFYSNTPVSGNQSMLYYPNLTNVFSDGRVCLGKVSIDKTLAKDKQAESLVDQFWKNQFSDHLLGYHFIPSKELHPAISSLKKWADESRINRNFILSVPWRYATTLEQALRLSLNAYSKTP